MSNSRTKGTIDSADLVMALARGRGPRFYCARNGCSAIMFVKTASGLCPLCKHKRDTNQESTPCTT